MSSSGIPLPEAPRLLLIRLGAMGDVLHTLPALTLLRRALPEAKIAWAVEPHWAPLLRGNPALDEVIEVPLKAWRKRMFAAETRRGWQALRDGLSERNFDAAIDFQGLIKSALLARAARPGSVAGFERGAVRESLAARFYTHTFPANRRHVVDKNLALARGVCGVTDDFPAAVFLPEGERAGSLPGGDFILASPLAGWKSKQWPPERYAELAALAWRQRRLPLVLDGAPADRAYLERIAAHAPEGACPVHVSSLLELVGATRAAAAVLGVDSGPMHLAAALNKPGVALFGPTDPERNGPYGGALTVLRGPGAETSYKRDDSFSAPMFALSAAEVWRELALVLDRRPSPLEVVARNAQPRKTPGVG
ncbi:MAG: lipopolysaccharide heptosyltransferase I [Acidobacteria bacterium]|nr:lipopolysaccharide heptosyltransferase I [Acidobacteriota bacterium]